MRKLSILLTTLFAGITAVAQGPVYSVNIVGFQRVDAPPSSQLSFVGTPFEVATNDLDNVVGTQATPVTDEIFQWTGSSYQKFILLPPGAGPNENKWVSADTGLPAPINVGPGAGFIFKNSAGSTNEIVLVGDVVDDPTIIVSIGPGLSLLSYPYSTSVDLNSTGLSGASGAGAAGDSLFVWNNATQAYKRYIFVGDIGDPTRNFKWLDSDTGNPAVVDLATGTAFFYQNAGAAKDWTENKPY